MAWRPWPANTWTNVDQYTLRHIASLARSELSGMNLFQQQNLLKHK